jgi:AcrR family transcriptional regulator
MDSIVSEHRFDTRFWYAPKVPRAKQRTPELAEKVLGAGLRLVSAEGIEALTARRLAQEAETSPAAVYELFGNKAGVVRAMFFSGFELLGAQLAQPDPEDPVDALLEIAQRYRTFILAHPALSALMFSRPFASFDPAPEESAAGASVRERIVDAVQRAIDAGRMDGHAVDIAHAYVALIHGLAAAESSHRLGRGDAVVQRRWDLSVRSLLDGFGATKR